MEEDIEISVFVAFSIWMQNYFCMVLPVVGAFLAGWKGFLVCTGISLFVFFLMSGIVGAFDA